MTPSTIRGWVNRYNNSIYFDIDDNRTQEEKELINLRKKIKTARNGKWYFKADCTTTRQKGKCTSHQIKNIQVEEILLREIRKVTAFAKDHEDEIVDLVLKKKTSELNQALRSQKRNWKILKIEL